jgi:hypothetical protein
LYLKWLINKTKGLTKWQSHYFQTKNIS